MSRPDHSYSCKNQRQQQQQQQQRTKHHVQLVLRLERESQADDKRVVDALQDAPR
jgi:hypothetical protein